MSAEVVKKRGRPKKVVSESVAAERMEPIVKGTRKKSTNASTTGTATTSTKSAEAFNASPIDVSLSSAVAPKRVGRTKASAAASKTTSSSQTVPPDAPPGTNLKPPKPSPKSSFPHIPPTSSKILTQVRALSSKAPLEAKPSTTTSPNPTKPISTTNTSSPTANETLKRPSQQPPPSPPPPATKPLPTPKATQTPPTSSPSQPPPTAAAAAASQARPSIPIAALNSTIVSQLSARAGARPSRPSGNNALPPTYKSVARKVTLTIVALPIAIVTSWVLYNRLVLGEDRKQLVRPGLVAVEDSPFPAVDEKDSSGVEKNA